MATIKSSGIAVGQFNQLGHYHRGATRWDPINQCYEVFNGVTWTKAVNVVNQAAPQQSPQVLTLGNPGNLKVHNKIVVKTQHGDVALNMDTGDITIPVGIGRDHAIRDFWLGFQEQFGNTDTITEADNQEVVKKRLIDKIRQKYASEKFIMVKPDDLIKFLESD